MQEGHLFLSQKGPSLCGAHINYWSEKTGFARLYPSTFLLLIIISFSITGCGTKMGVWQVDPRVTYDQFAVNAISEDSYSKFSQDVLIRYDLVQTFTDDPGQVLTFLHRETEKDYRSDLIFALAELNYLIGMRSRGEGIEKAHSHFFAATLYAYFYLLDEEELTPPDSFGRRFRIACDLYNSALGEALTDADGNLRIAPDEVVLPVGRFGFGVDTRAMPFKLEMFEKFVSTDRIGVKGFSRRNREAGLGAPVIAVEKKKEEAPLFRTLPGTLFLRVNCRLQDVEDGACTGILELYPTYDNIEIVVGGKKIPLERDLTAQLAYTVDQPYLRELGFNEFLHGAGYTKTGIYKMQPYDEDKIPIVFVHGTFSNPMAWAEMINSLRADPHIAGKYQVWNFFYDTGKRIAVSSRELADALTQIVNQLDPEGVNVKLHQMVVIGHSQGGLLTKMIATDTGDAFVLEMTGKKLSELDLSERQKASVEQVAIFKPLPFVKRVIFISTPHRGNYLSKNWVRQLALKLISLPKNVLQTTVSLMDTVGTLGVNEAAAQQYISRTSLDVMSPDNPLLQVMADIPLAKGITGHSIVAIDGDEMPPEGDDGVVEYTSAHVDYVESEFLVRSGHSCQSNPLVIEEVRRILRSILKVNQYRQITECHWAGNLFFPHVS